MFSQIWQWMRARYGRAFFGYGLLGFTFVGLAAMFWQVHVTTPFFAIGVAWSFRMAFARRKMRTVRLRNEELARLEALAERIGGATGRPMSEVETLRGCLSLAERTTDAGLMSAVDASQGLAKRSVPFAGAPQ